MPEMTAQTAERQLSLVGAGQDRRTVRTRQALRDALARQIEETGDLSRVTVKAVADTAGVTRRTFYSHFKDINNLVGQIEEETVSEVGCLVRKACADEPRQLRTPSRTSSRARALSGSSSTSRSAEAICRPFWVQVEIRDSSRRSRESLRDRLRTCRGRHRIRYSPGALRLLSDIRDIGRGRRAPALDAQRHGEEPAYLMACVMTALMFVRPGDLYGKKIKFGVPCLDNPGRPGTGEEGDAGMTENGNSVQAERNAHYAMPLVQEGAELKPKQCRFPPRPSSSRHRCRLHDGGARCHRRTSIWSIRKL